MSGRTFNQSVSEIEEVVMNQIEALVDEPEGGFTEKELSSLISKTDSITKLTDSYVKLNELKLDVVKTAASTKNLYNSTLGIESDKKEKLL